MPQALDRATGSGVLRFGAVFPTSDITARDYRVFASQQESDTWTGIFGPIATNA